MTISRSSPAQRGTARGRGLDALFDSSPTSAAGRQGVDADLAALLDNEVRSAGGAVPATDRATTAPPVAPREVIDVPPTTGGVRPALPAEPLMTLPPIEPSPAPTGNRPSPASKRFGAIIMDTSPAPTATPTPAGNTEEVGPAGELIMEPSPADPSGDRPLPAITGSADAAAIVISRGERSVPSGPGSAPEDRPLPATPDRTPDQKDILLARLNQSLDKNWQKALHQQIDDLYKQVATQFASPPASAEKALTMLREARQILIETPEQYVMAEYRTVQVRTMLSRTQESRKQAVHYGPRVLGYQVAWMVAFLLGIVFAAPLATWIGKLGNMAGATANDMFPFWSTLMWGGIGGVIGALYHLWWHISDQQDFDRQYLMWYLVQPIMGLVLGGIVFLLMAAGLLVLQVNLTDTNAGTAARLLPYLIAVLGGFRQNFIYEQFDRLVALFTPGSQKNNNNNGGGDSTSRS